MKTKTATVTSIFAGLPLALLGSLGLAAPSQAALPSFSGVYEFQLGSGDTLFANPCLANNAIDFQTAPNTSNNCTRNQFGTLGTADVTTAFDGAAADPWSLFDKNVDLMDVMLPGVKLTYNSTPTQVLDPGGGAITIKNLVRIDLDNDGSIGVGDLVFSADDLRTSRSDAGVVSLNFEGIFQEIDSVTNYGINTEKITTTGPGYRAILAAFSGTLGQNPNNLAVVGNVGSGSCDALTVGPPDGDGTDGTTIFNLDPTGPCATDMGALTTPIEKTPANPQSTFQIRQAVPEPSNFVGLLALGTIGGMSIIKRKQLKK